MTIADIQRALLARGYDLGPSSADGHMGPRTRAAVKAFQAARGLVPDGIVGSLTRAALNAAIPEADDPPVSGVLPAEWMPAARIERIVVHWSAGAHKASNLDRAHYHVMIQGDGALVRGNHSIAANGLGASGKRASHTLNCNSGAIGVSLCCMAGAIERPFAAGSQPMTRTQWEALPRVLADLCRRYGISVTPQTVLSHAEVQSNLGIPQRGKWDIARLAFDPSVVGAKACGDLFRARTRALLDANT